MQPVAIPVQDVVQQVDARHRKGEGEEARDRGEDEGRIENLQREDQAGEENQVLGPLVDPHRGEDVADHRRTIASASSQQR